jgi:ATP-dependent RNA helicase SUPV3L1/SUV3
MFNNRLGNVKFLVATDAIGMGLNLNIQRIIFSTLEKTLKRGKRDQIDDYTIK